MNKKNKLPRPIKVINGIIIRQFGKEFKLYHGKKEIGTTKMEETNKLSTFRSLLKATDKAEELTEIYVAKPERNDPRGKFYNRRVVAKVDLNDKFLQYCVFVDGEKVQDSHNSKHSKAIAIANGMVNQRQTYRGFWIDWNNR